MDFLQMLKANIKEILQIHDIKIKFPENLTDIEITDIYQKYVDNVKKYLLNIVHKERIGYFSDNSQKKSIYAYAYWIMTAKLIGMELDEKVFRILKENICGCQMEDGLCWDESIVNLQYLNGDGWGARHFMPHYFIAIERLGIKARYSLKYVTPFYKNDILKKLLDELDWTHPWQSSNVVMNIGVSLFYERERFQNKEAGKAVKVLQKWLMSHIRADCGMWGEGNLKSKSFKYALVRGAYHMYSFLIYDNIDIPFKEKAIDLILGCQNKYGGYDFQANSSACEDIDAIESLIRLSLLTPKYRHVEIRNSISNSLQWVIQNQLDDGGCVFRLGQFFDYGSINMTSNKNESNLFATWFRTLSVCYMYDFLSNNIREYIDLPGYKYPLFR
ncbi:prenyltransferase/squalene oxidase repeat-containing protein [Parablautia muri]|uniref:Uncharacterized protein n=1 Tax=Parablautia muri TaxID=2320879 RepID=A0A9X5GTC1_9FIRM|nr:hypothetical protein [Parablautia muri]NBJ94044.1 hypothetical protein [Parablautia muri]